jgi:hypothetical protein
MPEEPNDEPAPEREGPVDYAGRTILGSASPRVVLARLIDGVRCNETPSALT